MSQKELEMEIEQLQKHISQLQKQIDQNGLVRLLFAIVVLIMVSAGLLEKNLLLLLASFLPLLFFLLIAFRQDQAKQLCAVKKGHLMIDQKRLDRKSNAWQEEKTTALMEDQAHYLYDLDVIGKNSLYDYLHFCSCEASNIALFDALCQPLKSFDKIKERQEVFLELSKHPLSLNLLIEEALLSPKEQRLLSKEDFQQTEPMPFYLKLFTFVYPVLLLAALGLRQNFPGVIFVCMLAAVVIAGLHFNLWQEGAKKAQMQFEATEALGKLAATVMHSDLKHPFLKEKQKHIQSLYQLRKQLGMADQLFKMRNNPLLLVILDGLFFYDGWLYLWFSKQPQPVYLSALSQALGELGALCSLAQWFVIKERTVFPEWAAYLSAADLKHPLMASTQAVGATFEFKKGPVVITGSNMAGKTTFMRSLGLNLVLFYTGLSVDAASFKAPLLDIYTSMRVADRTQEGISTFYGELTRIKAMIQSARNQQPALFLIDEIFKGTNLKDRIVGARAVIEQLSYPGAFLFVSTHDEALCKHDHVDITNIHFSEYYQDGKIYFDYQLKPGVSQTTNARFLMQMIGLLE